MSLDQKVGQLYSVWTASKYGQEEINEVKRIIDEFHIGGLIFSLGNINDQIISHNIFQEQSNIPLLISMDAEWGLGMRLDDGFSFPYNITLGAIRDDSLVFAVGHRIGEHLKKIGVHLKPIDFHQSIREKDSVVVDMRNYYESEVGKFKNAITPNAHSSKELLPEVAKILEGKKDKKVHLYCTGGIRCEKTSVYLKKKGFKNIYQLNGGILNYLNKIKRKDSLWKGECFVFDNRISLKHGLKLGTYSVCSGCRMPISPKDKTSKKYEEGVSCPKCHDTLTNTQKDRFRMRQKQINVAKKTGNRHIFQKEY